MTKPPRQLGPRRTSASSLSSTHRDVPAVGDEPLGDGRADTPASDDHRVHGAIRLLLEDALGECDDQDLTRRSAQDEVHGRGEEPRLAPPARRRAEHDEIRLA